MLTNSLETNLENSAEETFESIVNLKFLTESKFAGDIEQIIKNNPDHNYITAIVEYCEINNLEVESVAKIISTTLKVKLHYDAVRLNFLKKQHTPPKLKFDSI